MQLLEWAEMDTPRREKQPLGTRGEKSDKKITTSAGAFGMESSQDTKCPLLISQADMQ